MPIVGKTDTHSIEPRWPRLGKLRKGAPRPESSKAPGRELPHFRFTSDRPEVQAAFEQIFGKEPKVIDVMLMGARPEDVFPNWMELWTAAGLARRCDGQTCHLHREGAQMVRLPKPCLCNPDKPECKQVGRLSVFVPALAERGYVGEITVETHSDDDLRTLTNRLQAVYLMAISAGRDLRGIPMRLYREPREISTPRPDGQRAKAIKHMVRIEPAREWMAVFLGATRQAALTAGQIVTLPAPAVAALPAPRAINMATGEIKPDVVSEIDFGEEWDGDPALPPAEQQPVVEAKPVAPKTATVTPETVATVPPAARPTLREVYDQLVAKAKALNVTVPAIPDRTATTVRAAYTKLEKLVLARATKVCMDSGLDVMQVDDPALIDQAVKIAAGR